MHIDDRTQHLIRLKTPLLPPASVSEGVGAYRLAMNALSNALSGPVALNALHRQLLVQEPPDTEAALEDFLRSGLSNDRNGSLAVWELEDALAAKGLPVGPAVLATLMAAYDDNGDGVLDKSELRAMTEDGVLKLDLQGGAASLDLAALPLSRLARVWVKEGDDNASLDISELKAALAKRGYAATDDELQRVMAAYDVNGDGVIDATEMARLLADQVMVPGAIGTVPSIDLQAVDVAAFMNRGVPNDLNGSLSLDELDAALVTDEGLSASPGLAADLLAMYDDNGDGVLDPAEVRQMVKDGVLKLEGGKPQGVDLAAVPAERALRVRLQDMDGDGSFSMQELQTFLQRRGCSATPHDVERLFAMYDLNGDGVVDQKELGAMLRDGVLSAATPNGLVLSLNLAKAPLNRVGFAIANYANRLQPPDLLAALEWFSGGAVGISREALTRLVLEGAAGGKVDPTRLYGFFAAGVFKVGAECKISFDGDAMLNNLRTGLKRLPGSIKQGFSRRPEADKSDFYTLVKLLSNPAAQKIMDLLEVRDGKGLENGRFGTYGLRSLANMSPDDPLWDTVAPEVSYSQRLELIDAAKEVILAKNIAFLNELSGFDGVFESGEIDQWLAAYERGFNVSDQIVDPYNRRMAQGGSNNCYVFASILALAATDAGKKILADSIHQNDDGSYTVTFAGDANHPIQVSAQDIDAYKGKFSQGDFDVFILEVAFEKYVQAHPERNYGLVTTTGGGRVSDALALLSGEPAIEMPGGSDQMYAWLDTLGNCKDPQGIVFSAYVNNAGEFGAAGPGFFKHAFTVLSIDPTAQTVTYSDPAQAGTPKTVTYAEFVKMASSIYAAPLT